MKIRNYIAIAAKFKNSAGVMKNNSEKRVRDNTNDGYVEYCLYCKESSIIYEDKDKCPKCKRENIWK